MLITYTGNVLRTFRSYPYESLGDTVARFLSQHCILMGISDGVERDGEKECEAVGRGARMKREWVFP